jgi:hypothetical protein
MSATPTLGFEIPIATKRLVGGVVETNSGTAVEVTAPFAATQCFDIACNPDDFFADGQRKPDGAFIGQVDAVAGKKVVPYSFKIRVSPGDQTLPLMTGAGYKLNTDTYRPTSDMASRKTWTLAFWLDGEKITLRGCSHTITMRGTNGGIATAEVNGSGVLHAYSNNTAMPAQTPIQAMPYVVSDMTLTFGGDPIPPVSNFVINLGGTVEEREDITSPGGGIGHYKVGDIMPTVELDPEASKSFNQMTDYIEGANTAMSMVLTSPTHTLTITAPRIQRRALTRGERNTTAIHNTTYSCNMVNGDDALALIEAAVPTP